MLGWAVTCSFPDRARLLLSGVRRSGGDLQGAGPARKQLNDPEWDPWVLPGLAWLLLRLRLTIPGFDPPGSVASIIWFKLFLLSCQPLISELFFLWFRQHWFGDEVG